MSDLFDDQADDSDERFIKKYGGFALVRAVFDDGRPPRQAQVAQRKSGSATGANAAPLGVRGTMTDSEQKERERRLAELGFAVAPAVASISSGGAGTRSSPTVSTSGPATVQPMLPGLLAAVMGKMTKTISVGTGVSKTLPQAGASSSSSVVKRGPQPTATLRGGKRSKSSSSSGASSDSRDSSAGKLKGKRRKSCPSPSTSSKASFSTGKQIQVWISAGHNEHCSVPVGTGTKTGDLEAVAKNLSGFEKSLTNWSKEAIAKEAIAVRSSVDKFPRTLIRLFSSECRATFESKITGVLSLAVVVAKSMMLQQKLLSTSPVAATPGVFPITAFVPDQWITSGPHAALSAQERAKAIAKKNDKAERASANPASWKAAAPTSEVPETVREALGDKLAKQVDALRTSLVKDSVAESTQAAYTSSLNTALALAQLPWSVLPVNDVVEYALLVSAVWGRAAGTSNYTVTGVDGVKRVKWSFLASFRSALRFYHEAKIMHRDFGTIASDPKTIRLWTSLKKKSHQEKQKDKESITFSQLLEVNEKLFSQHELAWKKDDGSCGFIGVNSLLKIERYSLGQQRHNQLKSFAACVRNMLMFRIGILGERRKSELIKLLIDSVESTADGGLTVQVLRGKTEHSRGDLSCGRKCVVPHIEQLRPSPKELLETCIAMQTYYVLVENWSRPPPRLAANAAKEFQADHDAEPEDLVLQPQHYVLGSFNSTKKTVGIWNSSSLNLTLSELFGGVAACALQSLSFSLVCPARLSFRKSGATIYSRTDRRAAIQNAGWTTALMSFTVYAKLQPQELELATKKCLAAEAVVSRVVRCMRLLRDTSNHRAACVALLNIDVKVRVCTLLEDLCKCWHLLSGSERQMALAIKWEQLVKAANNGAQKMLVSTDDAARCINKLRSELAQL